MALPRLVSITLDAPGADPKAPLRYAIAGTSEQRIISEIRAREDRGSGADKWRSFHMSTGFGVTAAPKGVALRVLPPEGDAAYGEKWSALQDRHLTAALDDRAQLGNFAFADGPGDIEELTHRLIAFTVPTPAEPVGIGAKWTVVWILRNQAVQKQTATYTLEKIDGGRWTIGVDMQRVGERQLFKDTGIELIALTRHYKGSVVIDPSKLLPVDGKLEGDSITQLRSTKGDDIMEETGTVSFTAK